VGDNDGEGERDGVSDDDTLEVRDCVNVGDIDELKLRELVRVTD
jgi:hypothetical protein